MYFNRKLLFLMSCFLFSANIGAFNIDDFNVLLKKNKINSKLIDLNKAVIYAFDNNLDEGSLLLMIKLGGFYKNGQSNFGQSNFVQKSFKNKKQNKQKSSNSQSLAWDIVKRAKHGVAIYSCKVDGKNHVFPCYVESFSKNAYLIHMPCRRQKGVTCPLHSIVNSEIFATVKNVSEFIIRATSISVESTVNGMVKKYLNGRAKTLHGTNMRKIMGSKSLCNIPTKGSVVWRTILDHVKNFGIWNKNFYRSHKALWDPRYRFKKTKKPEVLMYNIGGHWIALKIERLPNGKSAILFAESVAYSKGKYINCAKKYKKKLGVMAKEFGIL
ncbi:hypothetical protein ACFLYU_00850 [Candidatus Dependentiae bacterium]